MSKLTIMWQSPYCTATTLSFFEIVYIWIVIVYCFLFELLITSLLTYWLFIVLFTGVVLESELIVGRLVGFDVSGDYCGEESVSTLFVGETIPNQNCGKRITCDELVFLHFDVWWNCFESRTTWSVKANYCLARTIFSLHLQVWNHRDWLITCFRI